MSLIRKHGAVLQAWACLDLVTIVTMSSLAWGKWLMITLLLFFCISSVICINELHAVPSSKKRSSGV